MSIENISKISLSLKLGGKNNGHSTCSEILYIYDWVSRLGPSFPM